MIPTRSLDSDPRGIFRRYRILTPLLKREDGAYVGVRSPDVERLATHTRTRQVETELLQSRRDQARRHRAFGAGAHRCLGEALAKAELEEGLAVLAERLPQLQLDGFPPTLLGHSGIRRVDAMRVRW